MLPIFTTTATNGEVVLRMYPLPELKGFFFEFQCFVMPAQLAIQIAKIIQQERYLR
jgi:hypothetical protein